jgi:hypothetical protein
MLAAITFISYMSLGLTEIVQGQLQENTASIEVDASMTIIRIIHATS